MERRMGLNCERGMIPANDQKMHVLAFEPSASEALLSLYKQLVVRVLLHRALP